MNSFNSLLHAHQEDLVFPDQQWLQGGDAMLPGCRWAGASRGHWQSTSLPQMLHFHGIEPW